MAFKKNNIIDLNGIWLLMLLAATSQATNVDCNGKAFHCVDPTHFMICVDLGTGISTTIDDVIIPCPSPTICKNTNLFECEYPIPPKPSSTVASTVTTVNEVTTITPLLTTSIPFEEYFDTVRTTTLFESVFQNTDLFSTVKPITVEQDTTNSSKTEIVLAPKTNLTDDNSTYINPVAQSSFEVNSNKTNATYIESNVALTSAIHTHNNKNTNTTKIEVTESSVSNVKNVDELSSTNAIITLNEVKVNTEKENTVNTGKTHFRLKTENETDAFIEVTTESLANTPLINLRGNATELPVTPQQNIIISLPKKNVNTNISDNFTISPYTTTTEFNKYVKISNTSTIFINNINEYDAGKIQKTTTVTIPNTFDQTKPMIPDNNNVSMPINNRTKNQSNAGVVQEPTTINRLSTDNQIDTVITDVINVLTPINNITISDPYKGLLHEAIPDIIPADIDQFGLEINDIVNASVPINNTNKNESDAKIKQVATTTSKPITVNLLDTFITNVSIPINNTINKMDTGTLQEATTIGIPITLDLLDTVITDSTNLSPPIDNTDNKKPNSGISQKPTNIVISTIDLLNTVITDLTNVSMQINNKPDAGTVQEATTIITPTIIEQQHTMITEAINVSIPINYTINNDPDIDKIQEVTTNITQVDIDQLGTEIIDVVNPPVPTNNTNLNEPDAGITQESASIIIPTFGNRQDTMITVVKNVSVPINITDNKKPNSEITQKTTIIVIPIVDLLDTAITDLTNVSMPLNNKPNAGTLQEAKTNDVPADIHQQATEIIEEVNASVPINNTNVKEPDAEITKEAAPIIIPTVGIQQNTMTKDIVNVSVPINNTHKPTSEMTQKTTTTVIPTINILNTVITDLTNASMPINNKPDAGTVQESTTIITPTIIEQQDTMITEEIHVSIPINYTINNNPDLRIIQEATANINKLDAGITQEAAPIIIPTVGNRQDSMMIVVKNVSVPINITDNKNPNSGITQKTTTIVIPTVDLLDTVITNLTNVSMPLNNKPNAGTVQEAKTNDVPADINQQATEIIEEVNVSVPINNTNVNKPDPGITQEAAPIIIPTVGIQQSTMTTDVINVPVPINNTDNKKPNSGMTQQTTATVIPTIDLLNTVITDLTNESMSINNKPDLGAVQEAKTKDIPADIDQQATEIIDEVNAPVPTNYTNINEPNTKIIQEAAPIIIPTVGIQQNTMTTYIINVSVPITNTTENKPVTGILPKPTTFNLLTVTDQLDTMVTESLILKSNNNKLSNKTLTESETNIPIKNAEPILTKYFTEPYVDSTKTTETSLRTITNKTRTLSNEKTVTKVLENFSNVNVSDNLSTATNIASTRDKLHISTINVTQSVSGNDITENNSIPESTTNDIAALNEFQTYVTIKHLKDVTSANFNTTKTNITNNIYKSSNSDPSQTEIVPSKFLVYIEAGQNNTLSLEKNASTSDIFAELIENTTNINIVQKTNVESTFTTNYNNENVSSNSIETKPKLASINTFMQNVTAMPMNNVEMFTNPNYITRSFPFKEQNNAETVSINIQASNELNRSVQNKKVLSSDYADVITTTQVYEEDSSSTNETSVLGGLGNETSTNTPDSGSSKTTKIGTPVDSKTSSWIYKIRGLVNEDPYKLLIRPTASSLSKPAINKSSGFIKDYSQSNYDTTTISTFENKITIINGPTQLMTDKPRLSIRKETDSLYNGGEFTAIKYTQKDILLNKANMTGTEISVSSPLAKSAIQNNTFSSKNTNVQTKSDTIPIDTSTSLPSNAIEITDSAYITADYILAETSEILPDETTTSNLSNTTDTQTEQSPTVLISEIYSTTELGVILTMPKGNVGTKESKKNRVIAADSLSVHHYSGAFNLRDDLQFTTEIPPMITTEAPATISIDNHLSGHTNNLNSSTNNPSILSIIPTETISITNTSSTQSSKYPNPILSTLNRPPDIYFDTGMVIAENSARTVNLPVLENTGNVQSQANPANKNVTTESNILHNVALDSLSIAVKQPKTVLLSKIIHDNKDSQLSTTVHTSTDERKRIDADIPKIDDPGNFTKLNISIEDISTTKINPSKNISTSSPKNKEFVLLSAIILNEFDKQTYSTIKSENFSSTVNGIRLTTKTPVFINAENNTIIKENRVNEKQSTITYFIQKTTHNSSTSAVNNKESIISHMHTQMNLTQKFKTGNKITILLDSINKNNAKEKSTDSPNYVATNYSNSERSPLNVMRSSSSTNLNIKDPAANITLAELHSTTSSSVTVLNVENRNVQKTSDINNFTKTENSLPVKDHTAAATSTPSSMLKNVAYATKTKTSVTPTQIKNTNIIVTKPYIIKKITLPSSDKLNNATGSVDIISQTASEQVKSSINILQESYVPPKLAETLEKSSSKVSHSINSAVTTESVKNNFGTKYHQFASPADLKTKLSGQISTDTIYNIRPTGTVKTEVSSNAEIKLPRLDSVMSPKITTSSTARIIGSGIDHTKISENNNKHTLPVSFRNSRDPTDVIKTSDVLVNKTNVVENIHSGMITQITDPPRHITYREKIEIPYKKETYEHREVPEEKEVPEKKETDNEELEETPMNVPVEISKKNSNNVQRDIITRKSIKTENTESNIAKGNNRELLSPKIISTIDTNTPASGYIKETPTHELIKKSTLSTNDRLTSNIKSKDHNISTRARNTTVISNDLSIKSAVYKQTTTVPVVETITHKTNLGKFSCANKKRGKYADEKDCRKFYICIGNSHIVEGSCPANTVFSEINKQCTKNLSHCIRNNQFRCVTEGRFSDFLNSNVYYICVKNNVSQFIRFKLLCQNGYRLNKTSVRCVLNTELTSTSDISRSVSEQSTSTASLKKIDIDKEENKFRCEKEGRFPDPSNNRKYFVCTKNDKSAYRQKRKKCDSDEVFHKDKKKCVDES